MSLNLIKRVNLEIPYPAPCVARVSNQIGGGMHEIGGGTHASLLTGQSKDELNNLSKLDLTKTNSRSHLFFFLSY